MGSPELTRADALCADLNLDDKQLEAARQKVRKEVYERHHRDTGMDPEHPSLKARAEALRLLRLFGLIHDPHALQSSDKPKPVGWKTR